MLTACIVTAYLTFCKPVDDTELHDLIEQCGSQSATVCEVTVSDDDRITYNVEIK